MNMPSPVKAYFDADRNRDARALAAAFAADATVKDEGNTYAGREAIEAWWSEAKAKYEPVAAPLEVDGQGEAVKVLAEVTGNFPGSPVKLTFAFRLADARIEHLEITQ
ncbi:nuclear transport factor 2 family protein [Parvibaculum sp.]|uniref:nuclear transport factor 2 family protein n=1 Tax=Parvibaculum sp. TaxID=2024848 RepID=UPI001B00C343|nr:nuclear transport factor 2 family protein [Parvibaculum sp.]MBO6669729.1 nuclear transport factor 2 family protein [Parvibaculum sp.]MBO6693288.1 nuclear transport factor 2 family protein [Parvibaculum sp.]MBO6716236.1 nuclear transport factor 2 family protein [Parvibaculum sp.]